jgi:hypothetical protein
MLWLLAAACGFGILLGLRLRMPALVAASMAVVLLSSVGMPLADWSPLKSITSSFVLLGALQAGYLVGLMASFAWTRARLRPAGLASLPQMSPGEPRTSGLSPAGTRDPNVGAPF